jgi:hypothetical protein
MQPYNYSIDLPKPPADNFLQNIMGIAQLQNMSQQQKIAQQNAAFQKEMQPLEMEKARAGIAAQQSALAGSEQSRRQNEILFKQGQENRVREMEQQAIAQARQNELFGKLSALPPDAPMSAIIPIANELALVKPESAKQVMANYENAPKQFQKASETTLVSALNQLNANNIDGAKKTYSDFASAIENSMGKNPELKALADAAKVQVAALNVPNEEGVNIAKASGIQLLSLVNPQAVNAFIGAQETQAKTKTELAKLTPGGKEVDEEKRALDLEKERLQIQEIRQKLDQAREEKVKVFASTNKFAKELSDASATNQQSADIAKGILEKIDSGEVQIPSTAKGAAWQYVRDRIPLLGNDVTMLRKEYQKLANSEVIKSLPPGSASDADRRFAQEGVMSKDANPKQFRKGVEAMARLSEYASRYNEAKLAWVSQNAGSAGSALKEFSVFGAPIKKGAAFNAWWNKEGNKLDQNFMPDQAGAGTNVDALLNKYR